MLISMAKNRLLIIVVLLYVTGCGDTATETGENTETMMVNLDSNIPTVSQNGSITLSWTSAHVTSCTASGDWSGDKPTSGSQNIEGLTTNSNFSLSCSGTDGSVSDIVAVTVVVTNNGEALLSWTPPTENTDNSSPADLAGYKIFSGTSSGNYGDPITINDPGINSYLVENLAAAEWFFSVKAFNTSGTESAFAIEVSQTIN